MIFLVTIYPTNWAYRLRTSLRTDEIRIGIFWLNGYLSIRECFRFSFKDRGGLNAPHPGGIGRLGDRYQGDLGLNGGGNSNGLLDGGRGPHQRTWASVAGIKSPAHASMAPTPNWANNNSNSHHANSKRSQHFDALSDALFLGEQSGPSYR